MRVLVSAASRHGSTAEIAVRIGAVLSRSGLDVTVRPADDDEPADQFDAYVIGSAIYMGHWLDPARAIIRHRRWTGQPVWLFSSGPIGDPPKPRAQTVDVSSEIADSQALDHQVFAGALLRDRLSFGERAIVSALRAPYGDFRDWAGIEAWARGIAEQLERAGGPTPEGPSALP